MSGLARNTSEQKTTTSSALLFSITTPFGSSTPNDEPTSSFSDNVWRPWTVETPYKWQVLTKSRLFASSKGLLTVKFPNRHSRISASKPLRLGRVQFFE